MDEHMRAIAGMDFVASLLGSQIGGLGIAASNMIPGEDGRAERNEDRKYKQ